MCSDGGTALFPFRRSLVEEDAFFGPLFSTLFQQNVGRAFCARRPRSALVGRGRLTEGGSRLPFHPILP